MAERKRIGFLPGTIAPVERELWVAAIEKLIEAREKIHAMRSAKDRIEFAGAWTGFLHSLQLVYVRLNEEGINTFSNFQPWFGKIKNERENDPLLSYLYQARNKAEHSLAPLEWTESKVVFGRGFMGYVKGIRFHADGTYEIDSQPIDPSSVDAKIEIDPGSPTLIPIKNRGHIFEVPKSHLGNLICNNSPIFIADLGLSYHQRMVESAIERFGEKRPIRKKP